MSALDIAGQLDPNQITEISRQIGADPTQTRNAIEAAAPLLLTGAATTAQQPGGSAQIQQAVDSHAGIVGNLGQLIGAGGPADGGGLLGRILGQSTGDVHTGVQQASGLNSDQTKRLLAILAPIVLGMIAKRRSAGQHPPIDTHLQEEAQRAREQAQHRSPQIGGILGKILSYAEAPKR
ncbi:MAG TPA: DUF937 domain-containing protein [Gemmatimonadaceae bacterium]|nr:DUF937 domain-containing protein [Gemmatimonadaceae bacterium]